MLFSCYAVSPGPPAAFVPLISSFPGHGLDEGEMEVQEANYRKAGMRRKEGGSR